MHWTFFKLHWWRLSEPETGLRLDSYDVDDVMVLPTLLRSGETITIACSHNPIATANLFHVGKQYLTLCKAEAAVTRILIGRKIISSVQRYDARNSLPILDVIRSSHKRQSAVKVLQINATSNDRCLLYVLGAPPHFPTEYRQEAAVVSREHRMKWVVILGDGYQWPLPWECRCYQLFYLSDQYLWMKTEGDISRSTPLTDIYEWK